MPSSKTQLAYSAIQEMLTSAKLTPGMVVSEELLQTMTGMNRTPVREAVQLLTRERFFEIFPRKGIVVTDITLELLNEIYDYREVNEPFIAVSACGKVPENVLLEIRNKFCNPPSEDSEAKRKYLINLDTLLHSTLLDYCTNRFLYDGMKIVLAHDSRIKHFSYDEQANDSVSIPQHLAIIDSLLNHDLENIHKSSLLHIKSSRQLVTSSLLDRFIMSI